MRKQQGFTLIELVIVVIILGLLGAAAVPRFLDVTDDARDASVDGVAGGFASAVGLVRAQWEVEGRPAVANAISYDGVSIFVASEGYPTDTAEATEATGMNATKCLNVFSNIMTSAPTITGTDADGAASFNYYVTVTGAGAAAGGDVCNYFLTSTIAANDNGNLDAPANTSVAGTQGFTYQPQVGAVRVFNNNI